jgi:hypothetical protein
MLENEDATFLPNIRKLSPSNVASHPKTESSTTLLLTPQNSMFFICTVNFT